MSLAAGAIQLVYLRLRTEGWEQQDIPGLWRHPWKANGLELTTLQASRVENDHSRHPWTLAAGREEAGQ